MKAIKNLKDYLKYNEGIRLKPYKCTAGYLTIGVGRNLDGVGLRNMEEVEYLLNNDIEYFKKKAKRFNWFNNLNEVRQAVIIDMMFNLGIKDFLAFKKTIRYLHNGEYNRASIEMLDSAWAIQVPNRANRNSKMMASGEWLDERDIK